MKKNIKEDIDTIYDAKLHEGRQGPIEAAYAWSGGAKEILKLGNASSDLEEWNYALDKSLLLLTELSRYDFAFMYSSSCGHFLIDSDNGNFFIFAWDRYFDQLLKVIPRYQDENDIRNNLYRFCSNIWQRYKYHGIDIGRLIDELVRHCELLHKHKEGNLPEKVKWAIKGFLDLREKKILNFSVNDMETLTALLTDKPTPYEK
jgi:hypothetical protein